MQTHGTLFLPAARIGSGKRFGARILAVLVTLETWLARRRERLDLAQLDDHLLKDIGLSRADVERETAKPFWQA